MFECDKVVVLFALFACLVSATSVEFDEKLIIKLEHDLSGSLEGDFKEKGNLTIHSLRSGHSTFNQNDLTEEDIDKLKALAKEDKPYRLKGILTNVDNTESILLTSMKASGLLECGLNDILTVHLDYNGNVIAISLSCTNKHLVLGIPHRFSTQVFVHPTENGPVPDILSYQQKLEKERLAKERGDVKDNRSFLAKYWMYIVPVVIIMVISSATNPEAAAGNNGGSAR